VVKQSSDFAARVFTSLIHVLRTRYAFRTPSTASLFMGVAHVIHDAFSNGKNYEDTHDNCCLPAQKIIETPMIIVSKFAGRKL
jgi:hypothetical protein